MPDRHCRLLPSVMIIFDEYVYSYAKEAQGLAVKKVETTFEKLAAEEKGLPPSARTTK